MDLDQAAKTLQWLDDERRKDKQEITVLHERVAALSAENIALQRRLQEFEASLVTVNNNVQRVSRIDSILDGYRKEVTRQLEELERRRTEESKEEERLRRLERDATNKTLAELRKSLEGLPRLERENNAHKEEESRLARQLAELQLKVTEFNKHVDERNRSVTLLDEGRRQDIKRIAELQSEGGEVRKRIDDMRGKLEILEDMVRRTDSRLAEVFTAENERRAAQAQWIETQSVVLTEHERAFGQVKARIEAAVHTMENYAHRIDQYAESFREMRRLVDESRGLVEMVERRVVESAESHRMAEERFRQDWASFLADDQKRWTTHMLLRDEQWREQERQNNKQLERLSEIEEQLSELAASLQQLQAIDVSRMQTLLNVVRELAADYDTNFVKVR